MRCFGLTTERRRCANDAIDSAGYCEQHQRDAMSIAPSQNPSPVGILKYFRKPSTRVVPDDARLGVPGWLKRLSTPAIIEHLLHDPDSMRRWFAAYALRRRRDPAAVEPLWYSLQHDVFGMVRQQSAVALGKIGTPLVASPLIEALWYDSDAAVRQACAVALGNLGHPFAARDLANILSNEHAAFVRWDCVLALGQIGSDDVLPILSELATKDKAEVVRNACREVLGLGA